MRKQSNLFFALLLTFSFFLPCLFVSGDRISASADTASAELELSLEQLLALRQEPKATDIESVFPLLNTDLDPTRLGPYFDYRQAVCTGMIENEVVISREEAMADLEQFCDILKHTYGSYILVGGDQAFAEFRERCRAKLPAELGVMDFTLIVAEELAFTKDYALTFNWASGVTLYRPEDQSKNITAKPGDDRRRRRENHYLEQSHTFSKSEGKYLHSDSGQELDLSCLGNMRPVPTWTADFKLQYRLHLYHNESEQLPSEISFTDGSVAKLCWQPSELSPRTREAMQTVPYFADKGGILYINLQDYSLDFFNGTNAISKLCDAGAALKNAEFAIVDLRWSTAVGKHICDKFLNAMAGKEKDSWVPASYAEAMRATPKEIAALPYRTDREHIMAYDDKFIIGLSSSEIKQRDGLIVVLTNSKLSGTAEYLLDCLKHYSNVLAVGDASYGSCTSSFKREYKLSNSQVKACASAHVFFHDPSYRQPCRGIEPDIWLLSDDIDLDALAAYLSKLQAASAGSE